MKIAETPVALLALPPVVQIEPVGRRMLAGSPPALMAFDAYCRIVAGLRPPTGIHLHGCADPLLHPRLFDMVAHAVARGFEVSVTTRLPMLAPSRAEECVRSGLDRLRVLSEERAVPFVERGLRRLEEAKRRLQSGYPEVELVREGVEVAPRLTYAFSGLAQSAAPASASAR